MVKPIIKPCPNCGQDYQYRRISGRTFPLCETCRRPDCVVCGKKVPLERGRKNTCCETCQKQKTRNTQNAYYAKRIAENPELHKQNHAKQKQKRADNPELLAEYRQKERERNQRRQQDPKYRAHKKQYHAAHYADNREAIQAARRAKWQTLSEAEKEARRVAARISMAKSSRKRREALRQNPEAWAEHQQKVRAYQKERKRQLALARLQQEIEKLKDKS